jgi:hypothetical protein
MRQALVFIVCAALIAGCGGGGGAPSPGSTNSGGQQITTSMTITIPPRTTTTSSHTRRPKYVSPATESLTISAIYTDQTPVIPATVNVGPTEPGCSLQSSGATVCTISFQMLRGASGLNVFAYDQPDGLGNLVAEAQDLLPPQPDVNIIYTSLCLSGVVSFVRVALQGGQFQPGAAGARPLIVTALDADGYAIGGPCDYNGPIYLEPSDSSVQLSANLLTNVSQTVTATYNGSPTANTSITAYFLNNTSIVTAIAAINQPLQTLATPGPIPTITYSPPPATPIAISTSASTSTPTPTPTPTPTSTPSPTPIPSPTPTPSPTPSPTPNPVATTVFGIH